MVNPVVESPVPLAGAGFLPKPRGRYNPGEYKRLVNMEINQDGYLINRRNIYNCRGGWDSEELEGGSVGSFGGGSPYTNPQRFLGHLGEYTLITTAQANLSKQFAVGTNTSITMFSPYDLPGNVGSTGSNFTALIGYFRYNNKNYWVTIEYINNTSVNIVVYSGSIPLNETPASYNTTYAATLTRSVVLTFNYNTTDYNKFGFKNFFIYKERLWLALSNGLYFSKATDPAVFTVPSGGFFKHPNSNINYAMASGDTIYTLCSDAIYALTYNTDPNVDSTERPISETIGAEMGCVHVGTPYVINNLGIFAISGTNLEKILDNEFDLGRDYYNNRIVSFENYLVVQKYQKVNYLSNNANDPYYYHDIGSKFDPFQASNTLGYNLYFINTDNGSVHVVHFLDQHNQAGSFDYTAEFSVGGSGFISDLVVNPIKNANGNYKLFFLTNKFISNSSGVLTYTGDVYYMNSARDPKCYDYFRSITNFVNQTNPMIDIEISSFLPDGFEYKMKRFRSLLIEANIPGGLNLYIRYDNGGKSTADLLVPNKDYNYSLIDLAADTDTPFAHRIGLNQKARGITFKLRNTWGSYFADSSKLTLISDIRVLWTPTEHQPKFNGPNYSSTLGS